jgi:SET domain-containing protein
VKTNKVTYKDLIEVRRSPIQGRGVFARTKIKDGTRIIEYTGERISPDEETKRYDDENMKRHHTFLFTIDEQATIDAARFGNAARFINHSCDPNCEAVEDDRRIFIEAIRDIQPGEELSYDYNFEVDEDDTPELREFYVCRCGAPDCRGTILKTDE